MDTIYERTLKEIKVLRNSLVSCKHKVLNKLGRRISLVRNDIYGISFLIKNDLGLGEIKIYRALLLSLFPKDT